VLYDGACPLCRREVGVYQGLTPHQPLTWCDVSDPATTLPGSATREAYLARFHVLRGGTEVLSGARAFVALWSALPGWRWLARAAALPGVTPLLEIAYVSFLRWRPALQRLARDFEPPAAIPADLIGEMRSDHAGETGAVWIYHGVLAFSRDAQVREFARRHRDTERRHLQRIAEVLPWPRHSWLLVPWRAAGFATGALPAIFGPRAVYATIAAVETFVNHHYQQQIDTLAGRDEHAALRDMLIECQAEECEHRDESIAQQGESAGALLSVWCELVGRGSAMAVHIARRV
jgi:demethoxyubiquinone hydroxylase (CLK1/Coq7/Cat5 family)/predicted DCC family thiol-disulfide oxidoreductase YuxK